MSMAAPGPVEGPRHVAETSGLTGGATQGTGRPAPRTLSPEPPAVRQESPTDQDGADRALEAADIPATPVTRSIVKALAEAGMPATPALLRRLSGTWADLPAEQRQTAVALAARGLIPTPILLALGPPDKASDRPSTRLRAWMEQVGAPATSLLAGEDDPGLVLMAWVARLTPRAAMLARRLDTDAWASDTGDSAIADADAWPAEEAWPQGFARLVDPAAPWTIPIAWGSWTGRWTHGDREPDEARGEDPGERLWRTVLALEHPALGLVRAHLAGVGRRLAVRIEAAHPGLRTALAALVPEVSARLAELGWISPPWSVEPTVETDHGT
ncbi:MAG: flagellar hook-length control protein FliK [Candidatus Sericytochromatia bacterium]|nr:flagellar hook-length control protein FliK [Candidatus Sericytochromatia bacterium]